MELGHLLGLFFLIDVAVIIAVVGIANKKGIDVSSFRFMLTIVIIGASIIVIPFVVAVIPLKVKIIIIVLSLIGGFAYFVILYKIIRLKKNKK